MSWSTADGQPADDQAKKTFAVGILVIPAHMFVAFAAGGVLPVKASEPTECRRRVATDGASGRGVKAQQLKSDVVRVNHAMLVSALYLTLCLLVRYWRQAEAAENVVLGRMVFLFQTLIQPGGEHRLFSRHWLK